MGMLQAVYEPFRELAERNPNVWVGPPPPAHERGPEQPGMERPGTINGVELPHNVMMELRKLGVPLTFYNAGELRDATLACAVDCTLVDDDEGVSFQDKLVLNDNERSSRAGFGEVDRHRVTGTRTFGVIGFAQRIQAERSRASTGLDSSNM